MNIIVTRHARNRLRRTRLRHDDLIDLIEGGGIERRSGHRINLWLRWNDNWLRVVMVEEGATMVVVSVIWPAREPKGQ